MVRDVVCFPDRRLKLAANPIGMPGPAARRLAEDLADTARHYPRTVGIAAPQIGAMWRMAYVDCGQHKKVKNPHPASWLIDPVVVQANGAEVGREGCLSLPEITANVRRATDITVRYTDLDGEQCEITTVGFEARVILHEIDHLDGILILDRVSSLLLDVFPRKRRT